MNIATEQQIDTYLRSFRECLANMTVADREEIIREISVHVRESVEEGGANVGVVLARLGPAEQLAAQYTDDVVVRRAVASISPLRILHATLHVARRGVEGFVLFCIALVGYAGGIGFILTALLKSFYPRETGLWVGPHTFDFGFHTTAAADPTAHEALGWLLHTHCACSRWTLSLDYHLQYALAVIENAYPQTAAGIPRECTNARLCLRAHAVLLQSYSDAKKGSLTAPLRFCRLRFA